MFTTLKLTLNILLKIITEEGLDYICVSHLRELQNN